MKFFLTSLKTMWRDLGGVVHFWVAVVLWGVFSYFVILPDGWDELGAFYWLGIFVVSFLCGAIIVSFVVVWTLLIGFVYKAYGRPYFKRIYKIAKKETDEPAKPKN